MKAYQRTGAMAPDERASDLIARAKRGEGRRDVAAVVAHLERRSVTPAPATLELADVRRLAAVRERLNLALRTASTLPALRAEVAALSADLEDEAADTVRDLDCAPGADRAPSTPRESAAGKEYGE